MMAAAPSTSAVATSTSFAGPDEEAGGRSRPPTSPSTGHDMSASAGRGRGVNLLNDVRRQRYASVAGTESAAMLGQREFRFPRGRAVLAAVLLVIGIVVLSVGISERVWAAVVIGLLAFIPGSYQLYVLIQTLRGVHGFQREEVFDEVTVDND